MKRLARTVGILAVVAAAAATHLVPMSPAPTGTGPAAPAVTHFPAGEVKAAFARGAVLLDAERYMVHASRRDAAGQAEVHDRDTDIIYVLEGSAILVTGGLVVDGKTTAPGELRGSAIDGGDRRRLASGDVIVVPNGTPHWFQEVQPPLLYYVVKVRSMGGSGTGSR